MRWAAHVRIWEVRMYVTF